MMTRFRLKRVSLGFDYRSVFPRYHRVGLQQKQNEAHLNQVNELRRKYKQALLLGFIQELDFAFDWLVKEKMCRDLSELQTCPKVELFKSSLCHWSLRFSISGRAAVPYPVYESRERNKQKFRDTQTRRVRERGAQIDLPARISYKREGLLRKSTMVRPAAILFL